MAMRSLIAFLIALTPLFAVPAQAQVLSSETYIEQWDPGAGQWIRVAEGAERLVATPAQSYSSQSYSSQPAATALAAYGPFRVLDGTRASLVDVTDGAAPGHFGAMMRDFPALATLEMVECPGTDDDRANMKLGRMIRAAGIATHVPAGGSVRSGAVELFLAGAERQIDEGAEFAVHAWLDDQGRQPQNFAPDAPENRLYLDYYTEMGMAEPQAQAFYDMTNSVANDGARWLTAQDMRAWLAARPSKNAITPENTIPNARHPAIAYLDLDFVIP